MNQYKVFNKNLGLKFLNSDYGNLDILNQQQREIVDAVYQITNCGKIKDCLRNIRPLTLNNISKPSLNISNRDRLQSFFIDTLPYVELNCNVLSITSDSSHCTITTEHEGETRLYTSKYVLVSMPPAEIFSCIKNINAGSLEFYSNISYQSGSVCILIIKGESPNVDLMINSHEIWSACFVTNVSEENYILHLYIPDCRRVASDHNDLDYRDLYLSVQDYLQEGSILKEGIIKHWKILSPNLHQETLKKYSSNHYKLTPRVWYCGELANFEPRNVYTFGTQAALSSGKNVARELLSEVNTKKEITLDGLFNSEVYKMTDTQPLYLRSRDDGNIAYYGVIASAFKEQSIVNYLTHYSRNYQWEFHDKYGPTLEDSLLVIEGLIDATGVERVTNCFDIDQYISSYLIEDCQLFSTVQNGCSNYWNGPSLMGNAHILYILEKLQINDHRINKYLMIEYLLSRRNSCGLWESKWFTNNFYTSFYIVRGIITNEACIEEYLDINNLMTILEQALRQYSASENFIISKLFIIRTLILLMKTSIKRHYALATSKQTMHLCVSVMKHIKTLEISSSHETLLYYWQDIVDKSKNDKIFITSKPKKKLLEAMIKITNDEVQSLSM